MLLCSRGLADWGKGVWLERDRAEDHSLQMPNANPKFKTSKFASMIKEKIEAKSFIGGQTDEDIAVCVLGAVVGQCLRHNCEVRKAGRDEHRSLIPTDSEVVKGVGID